LSYVPGRGRFLVTFNTVLGQPEGGCTDVGVAYKEFSLELEATGNAGVLSCEAGRDTGSLMVGNTFYLASMKQNGDATGWQLAKYDALTWSKQVDLFHALDYPKEVDSDPMLAWVNGQLDISSQYDANGTWPDIMAGAATFHYFFTSDLQLLGKRILDDTEHITGSSLIFVDGTYYFVTANAFLGDLIVMRYDANWGFLGSKVLKSQVNWSEGLLFDGQHFLVSYMDTSQRAASGGLPLYLNVRLAAFDRDWNLVEDIPITSFAPADLRQPGRPSLTRYGDRLYVAYDCDTIDPGTHQEQSKWQAYIAVVSADFPPAHQPRRRLGQAGSCYGVTSPLDVLHSRDHGATWTPLGNACLNGSTVWAVDPTGLLVDGRIVLYFLDMMTLKNDHSTGTPRVIYRAESTDGIDFTTPTPAFTEYRDIVDPTVVRNADGSFRMYVPSDQEGIISAFSSDGLSFAREGGVRATGGGMPGALLLPDGRIRLFLCGGHDGVEGIFSMLSSDGLAFTAEGGIRIPSPPHSITDNPQPLRLADGSYLMLFQIHDIQYEGQLPWLHTEIHVARSADTLNWAADPTIIGYGGTSCIVEAPDGTLYLYYVAR
jgi:hypothetical protein